MDVRMLAWFSRKGLQTIQTTENQTGIKLYIEAEKTLTKVVN